MSKTDKLQMNRRDMLNKQNDKYLIMKKKFKAISEWKKKTQISKKGSNDIPEATNIKKGDINQDFLPDWVWRTTERKGKNQRWL